MVLSPERTLESQLFNVTTAISKVTLWITAIAISFMDTPTDFKGKKGGGGPPDSKVHKEAASVVPSHASAAGASSTSGTITSSMSHLVSSNWIIDTGSTNHMAHNLNPLSNIRKLSKSNKNTVQLPNGEQVTISHTGDLSLFKDKSVHHVLYIPDFKFNLMSVSKELFIRKVMGIGQEEHGLYILKPKEQEDPRQLLDLSHIHSIPFLNTIISEQNGNNNIAKNKNSPDNLDDTSLRHKRLGHAPLRVLKKKGSLNNAQLKEHVYTVLPVAKQTGILFSLSNACSIQSFDHIHADFNSCIKCLRSDNGTEFFNRYAIDLLQEHDIVHQSFCVYTPQQNVRVERRHRSILDMARALRFQAFVILELWGEYVTTNVYILNRLPTIVLKGAAPFERLFHKTPSLQHLRIFGSLCYAINMRKTDKFCPRAVPAIHLGYSSIQKGYVLYDLYSQLYFC
uniref:Integrase catalytic domain-containing protein n=1 Tax=Nicotiana tabacum TaxID=4097 RepID=A0A1S3XSN8_TOBAC|nr:PREDICTED: uncharacterized protein LOC107768107 [Nicotiana tabacum]